MSPSHSERRSTLPDVILHQIAQSMCFAKHGDLRYDPGNPKHGKWLERARAFASVARISHERISNDDGAGSWPPQASDHPETYAVRMVGGWVNERGGDDR